MRKTSFSLLALLGLAASPALAAESGEAQDRFLTAYLSFQKAEKAEGSGNLRGAISSYNQTIEVLDDIALMERLRS